MFNPDFDLIRAIDCMDGVDADLLEHLAFSTFDRFPDRSKTELITDGFYENPK